MPFQPETIKTDQYRVRQEPFYQPTGDEIEIFEAALQECAAGAVEGSHGLWKDPLHGIHGVAPEAAAHHRILPR